MPTTARYEPVGWMQWPDNADFSFQFMRTLGAAQEGASTVSECFQAASRITEGDTESWHREWMRLGAANRARAEAAEQDGNRHTARTNWLRAANYYRSAEFFLSRHDPRRLMTFDHIEDCSHHHLALLTPPGEIVRVPYTDGHHLDAYLLHPWPNATRQPVVIAFGGLDEYKDELLHELPRHALPRGLSLLLVDLPGQGGSLRRQHLTARHDTEIPVAACVDYLLTRPEIDPARILLYGASLGGYYSARAASFEHRLKAAVSDGGLFDYERLAERRRGQPESLMTEHLRFVTGTDSIAGALETLLRFKLAGVLDHMRCPLLLTFGEHDFLGLDQVQDCYAYAREKGLDVTLKIFSAQETGASHCQVDNPTFGQEYICDWLARQAGIDQSRLPPSWAYSAGA